MIYRGWLDDQEIAAYPISRRNAYRGRFGASLYGLHRAELQRMLAESLGPDHLHLGQEAIELVEVTDGARVRFASGSHVDADIVVGADGVHSVTRSWVTSEQPPEYTGTSGFRGLVPIDAVASLPGVNALQIWMGPGAHVVHYPIPGLVNFLAVVDGPAKWPWANGHVDVAPGELAAHFAGWSPSLLSLLNAVPQSSRWALLTQPPLQRWNKGRVVLMGDAAHAMPPHHGQGAAQTIEDAIALADCLVDAGPGEYAATFHRYERLRRARTRLVQRSSLEKAALLHLPDGVAATRRNNSLLELESQVAWLHGHDAQPDAPSEPSVRDQPGD
jgi:salicylate hydroxylase